MGADKVVGRSPLAEIEDRLGVRPLEELHAKRRELLEQIAPLRSLHGPFGLFDAQRKILLATLAMKARAIAVRENSKVTEAALTDLSHASPEYAEAITTATLERSRLTMLEAKVQDIEDEIRRSDAVIRYLSAEARL